jgi:hypothetical protein
MTSRNPVRFSRDTGWKGPFSPAPASERDCSTALESLFAGNS